MKTQEPFLASLSLAMLLCLPACGTQIGNPTGGSGSQLLGETSNLETATNAALMSTIDGINVGDYAYSKSESRVVTLRRCELGGPQGASLVQKAETSHRVEDETPHALVSSELTIERTYQDKWSQNGQTLACDPSGQMALDYRKLEYGSVSLRSQVAEDLQRKLALTNKDTHELTKHSLILHREGYRDIKLLSYRRPDNETVEITATLAQNDLVEDLALTAPNGEKVLAKLTTGGRPLTFKITLDRVTQQWTSYTIDQASLEFLLNAGESFVMEFDHLRFDRAKGCVPQAGSLQVTEVATQGRGRTFRGTFDKDTSSLNLNATDGVSKALSLAPFGCVLKER